jgi:hypothetical protein
LVEIAQQAEASGFGSVRISDHFHPWTDVQGQSPFVWAPIGGIAATTELSITTTRAQGIANRVLPDKVKAAAHRRIAAPVSGASGFSHSTCSMCS